MQALLTPGYKELRFEFTLSFGDDDWDTTMSFLFAVAEVAYHAGNELPAHWQFRDSPMHSDGGYEAEDYPASMIQEIYNGGHITDDDLITFGNVLTRYAHVLEAAGKSY